jgi:hypothetical protein
VNEPKTGERNIGVESIRIKGRKIGDLPLGQGNQATAQLPDAINAERLAAIETVNAEFPTHRIDYLVSRIKECEENKDRMQTTIDQLNTMTSEYNGQIRMCEHRDKEITKLDEGLLAKEIANGTLTEENLEEHTAASKALFKQFPPYSVDAMRTQISQNNEGIQRCKTVVKAEDASILEFTEVVMLCKQRDKALAKLGAVAQGS